MIRYSGKLLNFWPYPIHKGINIDKALIQNISLSEIRDLLLIYANKQYETVDDVMDLKFLTFHRDDSVWLIRYRKKGVAQFFIALGSSI